MDRVILHCDMNAFFASVELLSHPELRDKPVAVCGTPENRHGIILAKNEAAKKYGVITAETIWQARKKCPKLHLLKPHMEKYRHYCRLINDVYKSYTDLVEPFSIDESWLDVTGSTKLFGDGIAIADEIRKTVREKYGLTLSAGVSYNKIFAKMGSDYKKPDATTYIGRDNYKAILWPMPVRDMFFVGKATADKLYRANIRTIGDLAGSNRTFLSDILGKQGLQLHDYANGNDTSPVSPQTERRKMKSVGNGMTFKRDLVGENDIRTALAALCDTVSARLRKYQMKAGGVKVDIKDNSFKTISRQKQLDIPTNLGSELSAAAFEIIRASWPAGVPVRLLTVTGINLCDENEAVQLSFFSELQTGAGENARKTAKKRRSPESSEKLERTMDSIRDRFGAAAITYGGIIDNDLGIELESSDEDEYDFGPENPVE
ncbi:MAG: DNA polymerase IV [Clostridia bacterium]|nr:DNA polymerase IV [Clostridia bacterium]